MFILRAQDRRASKVSHATIGEEELRVGFSPTYRRKRTIGGMFVELEQTGIQKSVVDLAVREARDGRGNSWSAFSHLRVPLLQRHDHVRRLSEQDEKAIAAADALILTKIAEISSLRAARAELVKDAWRRGGKLQINELEDRAKEGAIAHE